MKFYDVSLPIKKGMIVYPGNPEPSIRLYSSIPQNKVNESLITLGSHTGTHVDSRLHIQKDASGVDLIKLSDFYGKSKVLDLTYVKNEIHREDLEDFQIQAGDIILLKQKTLK